MAGRFHSLRTVLLLTMVLLFAITVIIGAGYMLSVYREKAQQNGIVRDVESINLASNKIIEELSAKSETFAKEQYDSLYELIRHESSSYIPEEELEEYFRSGFANKFKECFPDDLICGLIAEILDREQIENVKVLESSHPTLDIKKDSAGRVESITLSDIALVCVNQVYGGFVDTISFEIKIPEAIFYDGNEDLFGYCMVAKKGVYITGETSSVLGNIYAGDHEEDDNRDAELVYGETGYLGGLNILSTQLGIEAERILTKGDINMNGSFVIFSPEVDSLKCYAHRMNQIESYKNESVYSLDGEFVSLDKTTEEELDEYNEYLSRIDYATNRLELISDVYDSAEDSEYQGKYHKIISNYDVDINEDFTGIVVTSQNVIIERNVNFEGLIVCGDRIYVRGNNNIVANRNVLQSIIAEEFEQNYESEAKDYIGGIVSPGLNSAEYGVIPYR